MSFFPTPVIVGIDGTPASRHALLAAVELCTATGSQLHLVHVKLASGMLRGRPMTPTQRQHADDEGYQLLERERGVVAEAGLEVSGIHLRYGEDVEHAVVRAQQEHGAGLLVIGAGTSGTLARRLTGSGPATAAVRRSPASVLVVRETTAKGQHHD